MVYMYLKILVNFVRTFIDTFLKYGSAWTNIYLSQNNQNTCSIYVNRFNKRNVKQLYTSMLLYRHIDIG